jgi:hypothetical protein
MLLWAERFDVPVSDPLIALRRCMTGRPAVRAAMQHEGLVKLIETNVSYV